MTQPPTAYQPPATHLPPAAYFNSTADRLYDAGRRCRAIRMSPPPVPGDPDVAAAADQAARAERTSPTR